MRTGRPATKKYGTILLRMAVVHPSILQKMENPSWHKEDEPSILIVNDQSLSQQYDINDGGKTAREYKMGGQLKVHMIMLVCYRKL